MRYLIRWDAGFGESRRICDFSEKEAKEMAYQCWLEEAESHADYDAEELTDKLCDKYGIDKNDVEE